MISQPLIIYTVLMIIAATISTYGSIVTLPFEHLDAWSAIKMALPYAWVDWIFLTIAIHIGKKYDLVSPLQMKFSITLFKFLLILLFTKYYLKSEITKSDIIGFIIVVLAYFMNIFHFISKYVYGIDIGNEADKTKQKEVPVIKTDKDIKDKESPKQ
jgi:hypothetical protein